MTGAQQTSPESQQLSDRLRGQMGRQDQALSHQLDEPDYVAFKCAIPSVFAIRVGDLNRIG